MSKEEPINLNINGTAQIKKQNGEYTIKVMKAKYTRFLNTLKQNNEIRLKENKFYIFNNLKTLKTGEGNQQLDLEGSVFEVLPGGVKFYKKYEDAGVSVFFAAPDNVINIEIVMNDTFNACEDIIFDKEKNIREISYNKQGQNFIFDTGSVKTKGCYKFKNIIKLFERKEAYNDDRTIELGKNQINATGFIVWPRGIEFVRFDDKNNPITVDYKSFWLPSMTMKLIIYIDPTTLNLDGSIILNEETTTATIKIKKSTGKIAFKQYKSGIVVKKNIAETPINNKKKYLLNSRSTVKHGENIITSFKLNDNNTISLFNGDEPLIGQFQMPVDFTVEPKPKSKGGKRRTRKGRSKKSRKSIRRR